MALKGTSPFKAGLMLVTRCLTMLPLFKIQKWLKCRRFSVNKVYHILLALKILLEVILLHSYTLRCLFFTLKLLQVKLTTQPLGSVILPSTNTEFFLFSDYNFKCPIGLSFFDKYSQLVRLSCFLFSSQTLYDFWNCLPSFAFFPKLPETN